MYFRTARLASTSRLKLLAGLPMFQGLGEAELRRVDALVCPVQLRAGHVLTRQGSHGREAFLVVSGAADVEINGRTVARVGPGEVIGELALLGARRRTATVTALTQMEVLVMDREQFAGLLADRRIAERVDEVARVRQSAPAR